MTTRPARRANPTIAGAPCAALLTLSLLSCSETRGPESQDHVAATIVTKAGVEMVVIPGGPFIMGSGDKDEIDEPPHEVVVSPFYIDRYEVTQEEYERVLHKNPSLRKGARQPVEQIRWADAAAYCNARSRLDGLQPVYDLKTLVCDFGANGYRLPTEAEWEYAARAGTTTRFFFGDNQAKLKLHAWFTENCMMKPRPVGTRQPNPWGLYDIYGNVWEWCHDFYQEDYYKKSPKQNPKGPETGRTRVMRGGCWHSRPNKCRSSYRYHDYPDFTDQCFQADFRGFVGFRCVRSATEPTE
jgi:formylglycine-generating enzyme required for sulfatase activity